MIGAQRIVWRGPAEGSAKDLMAQAEAGKPKPGEFLRALLADKGPMLASEAIAHAADAGYSEKQMTNAAHHLNVKSRKVSFEKGWEWSLPEDGDKEPSTGGAKVIPIRPKLRKN